MSREHRHYYTMMRDTKRVMRREGYNRGIRAAAKIALDGWDWGTEHREQAERTSKAILKLLKPPLDLDVLCVKPYKSGQRHA